MSDTIFALASGSGRAAVAVIRLSGPQTGPVLAIVAGKVPAPRRASVRRLRSAVGEEIDQALVLWMPGPASFTGEDCAELQLHGGVAVVAAVTEALLAVGLRPAEPGEFTRRAFEAGRLDLTQAEAVADLVDAETEGQRRQAAAQLGGALSRRYDGWRDALLDSLALLEVGIDFPDEDIPGGVADLAAPGLDRVRTEIAAAAEDGSGERVRQGFRIALLGAPNVGKSSLLNALARRDAAIVTAVAGTTRDVVEVHLVIGGQAVVLADTAGLRDVEDQIEAEGVRRARLWAERADVRLGVVDGSRPETLDAVLQLLGAGDLVVLNKMDLGVAADLAGMTALQTVETSAASGDVGTLDQWLTRRVAMDARTIGFPGATRERHRRLLVSSAARLGEALEALGRGAELAAESVRLAVRDLEQVTGRSHPEAVLDRVFSTFCIGK